LVKCQIEYRDWKSEIVRRMMKHPVTSTKEAAAKQLQSCEKKKQAKQKGL